MELAKLWILLSLAFKTGLGIHGGEFAEVGEFPHQVQLYYGSEFLCGGSIISHNLVLTAAHCVHDVEVDRILVVAGTNKLKHNLPYPKYSEDLQAIVFLQDYYLHSGFNKSGDSENDIGILLLASPLLFSKTVRSITLPEKNESLANYSPNGVVAGWGQAEENGKSTRLKKLSMFLGDDERCKFFFFKRSSITWFVRQNEICVRTFFGDGICPGDSGGGLICEKWDSNLNTSTSVLCGISSKSAGGDLECGDDLFQVFVNVAEFRDWIDQTVSNITSRILCKPDHFFCTSNRTCLPRSNLCDKKVDCAGGEDETDCENYEACGKEQFRCNNGKCVGIEERCDGTLDCEDMPGTRSSSDEEKCPKGKECGDGMHDCGEDDRCISITAICNGIVDCKSGSDEDTVLCNAIVEFTGNETNGEFESSFTVTTPVY